MTDDPNKSDFTQSINKLEEINSWFQSEDFNLDEGLQKLKEGKELIKKCRTRLQVVENEFVKINQEFVEDGQELVGESNADNHNSNGTKQISLDDEDQNPDQVPF